MTNMYHHLFFMTFYDLGLDNLLKSDRLCIILFYLKSIGDLDFFSVL